ncbi:MAG TPA: magnesium-translocating P-type ATPase [Gammaproteobacteria bacterium]|jgi:Mg2+-importing ATPase|nr:magnesium-translocating P-type ATPase [Gammaproteobacteria bacterium]
MEMKVLGTLQRIAGFFRGGEPGGAQSGASVSERLLSVSRMAADDTFDEFHTSIQGLIESEAEERLAEYGPNTVAREEKKGFLKQLFTRLINPLNILLIVLTIVSFVTGDIDGGMIIGFMVLLSVVLSWVQEARSTNAAEKLRAMVKTTATALRREEIEEEDEEEAKPEADGEEGGKKKRITYKAVRKQVPLDELVPGDLVQLSAGDMIPADVRLLSAKDLFINQAALTGESLPVEKSATAIEEATGSPLDLPNLCFMGTNVVSGTAIAIVVMTGANTYFGALASTLGVDRTQTSFDKGIHKFTWLMIRFMAIMVPLVFLINGLTKHAWGDAFLFAMAVAVGLTPEMLPVILSSNLAKGALVMSRHKVIVKRLSSIQNFGAMDVLCTDKTGTLTQDKVFLEKHVDIHGVESERVLEFAFLNSYYQSGLRNLLDVAVLEKVDMYADLHPEKNYRKVDEIPFDFQRRRMSVVVEEEEARHVLICKGAVEEIFSICSRAEIEGEIEPLVPQDLLRIQDVTLALNEDGFRVIAVAYKETIEAKRTYSVADESGMVLLGYIAFLDPPKETAKLAIAKLNQHGVAVKVLTGDNDTVTRKICSEVGLEVSHIVLGRDLENMSDEELAEKAETTSVFAKLAPEQKARVIRALHRRGHVVGFLGDGINDGPALKAADVGISVDTAVDIAKESADIILLEKNLLVLEEGVLEGRKVFGNIVKYIKMGASSNFGNMFSVLGASIFLPFVPMAPIQVLVNNLLYDFSQIAIPTDNVDPEYLEKPRRWDLRNIGWYMLVIGPLSSVFDYVTFGVLIYYYGAWHDEKVFQTGWFIESIVSQTLIVHVIRTGKVPFLQSWPSWPLLFTTIAVCAIGMWLPFSGFAHGFSMVPVPVSFLLVMPFIMVGYITLTQWAKSRLTRRFGLN